MVEANHIAPLAATSLISILSYSPGRIYVVLRRSMLLDSAVSAHKRPVDVSCEERWACLAGLEASLGSLMRAGEGICQTAGIGVRSVCTLMDSYLEPILVHINVRLRLF